MYKSATDVPKLTNVLNTDPIVSVPNATSVPK